MAVAAGFYFLGLSLQTGRRGYDYLAGAAFGLAVLSKGLVGIIIPGMVLPLMMILERRAEQQLLATIVAAWAARAGRGIVALLIVAAPWFVAEGLRHGYPFFDLFFFGGNERFVTRLQDLPKGPVYVAYLLIGLLPWSGLLWHALRRTWDGAFHGGAGRVGDRLLLAWFLGVLFLFGVLVGWKVMRYILPLYPAAAIMLGRHVDALLSELHGRTLQPALQALRRAALILAVFVVPLVAVGLFALSRQFPQEARPYLQLLGPYLAGLGVTLLAVAAAFWRGRLREGLACGLLLSAGSYVLLINSVAAGWDTVSPWRVLAQAVARHHREGVPVLFDPTMPPHGNWFVDYYVEPRPELAWSDEDLQQRWLENGRILLLTRKPDLDRFLARYSGFAAQELVKAADGWVLARGWVAELPAPQQGELSGSRSFPLPEQDVL